MDANRIGLLTSISIMLLISGILVGYIIDACEYQRGYEKLHDMGGDKSIATEDGIIDARYARLWQMNHDLIGWIYVPDTSIDYPVMQRKGEAQYYLRRTFDGKKDSHGTPFMSAFSSVINPTDNWLIYGHNMHDGTMFHDILRYQTSEYYKDHKQFNFDTIYKGGQGTYEVVAAVKTQMGGDRGFDYESYASLNNPDKYGEFIEQVKARSLYNTALTPEYCRQLITLSTCEYSQENGRFYLVAARIR